MPWKDVYKTGGGGGGARYHLEYILIMLRTFNDLAGCNGHRRFLCLTGMPLFTGPVRCSLQIAGGIWKSQSSAKLLSCACDPLAPLWYHHQALDCSGKGFGFGHAFMHCPCVQLVRPALVWGESDCCQLCRLEISVCILTLLKLLRKHTGSQMYCGQRRKLAFNKADQLCWLMVGEGA